jgi:hypothetical protein
LTFGIGLFTAGSTKEWKFVIRQVDLQLLGAREERCIVARAREMGTKLQRLKQGQGWLSSKEARRGVCEYLQVIAMPKGWGQNGKE